MRNYDIGPTAERDELKGSVYHEQVFKGGPKQPHTTLSARFLEAGKRYEVRGALTINGDIPEKVILNVHHGELIVNGNVGGGSVLNVSIPLVTHTQHSRGPGYCYRPLKGSFGYSAFCSHSKTIVDGTKYDDPDAAIRIQGTVAATARLKTSGGVDVNGQRLTPKQYAPYKPKQPST